MARLWVTSVVLLGIALTSSHAVALPEGAVSDANRHALGVSGGVAGHSGFAYRYSFGDTSLQVNGLAIMLEQGSFFAGLIGLDLAHNISVWRESRVWFLPSALAIRAVAGVSGMWLKNDTSGVSPAQAAPAPVGTGQSGVKAAATSTVKPDPWGHMLSAGAGLGVELGSVGHPGFAVTLDLRPTWAVTEDGFWGFVMLPYGSMMYSW